MTPKGPPSPCPVTGCDNWVDQTPGAGRRRKYCSDACGVKYRKYQRDRSPDSVDHYAAGLAGELVHQVGEVARLVRHGETLRALEALTVVMTDCDHLRSAVVEQGHAHRLTTADMAAHLHVSKDTITRWKGAGTRRRIRAHRTPGDELDPPDPSDPGSRHPRPAGAQRRLDRADGPASVLARALAQLRTDSGRTHGALATAIGVDRSYIHHIVAGSRIPSWRVAEAFAAACDADPRDIRPLWDAARGYQAPRPAALNAVLRGLSLAAGHPDPGHLHALVPALPPDLIAEVLNGTTVPEWPTVRTLVTAMGGDPHIVLPFWATPRTHPDPPPPGQPPAPENPALPGFPAFFRASG
jgi:DNA-binding XRE family transcriptional regulator